MNAIFGCLLSLGGALLLIDALATRDNRVLGLSVVLISVGLFMLVRHRSYDDDVIDLRDPGICLTCRGAGTVYSAEWNDWRKTGPVHTIREVCPSCQGVNAESARLLVEQAAAGRAAQEQRVAGRPEVRP